MIQAYEGVCIARKGSGMNESFTVRKISYGEGVERVFPMYSPLVEGVEVVRRGKVRRAKLYYLRGRRGKSARIVENTGVFVPRSLMMQNAQHSWLKKNAWKLKKSPQLKHLLKKKQQKMPPLQQQKLRK